MSTVPSVTKMHQLTGHNAAIYALSPYISDSIFLSGGGEGWIAMWDLKDPEIGKLVAQVETQIFALHYIPGRNLIVAGNMNGGVHFIYPHDLTLNANISRHQKGVFGVQYIDPCVFTIGGGGMLTKWALEPARTLESFQLSNQPLRSIAYQSNRNELAVGSSDGNIYLLDAATMQLKQTIKNAHDNSVFCLKYHPDAALLFSGGRDAHLKVWALDQLESAISQQPAHWFTINSLAFDPDGKWLATGSRDKTIKIWDTESFKLLKVLETVRDKGHVNSVNALYWAPFNNYLISASDDRSMIVWEIK